ncbi:MAG: YqeG family HAD IIIA-type phosphatase [Bacillota bacterium]|nr:YqeG family HAD IIIA-type phosphatase [Bacillota bacterium]
MGQGLMPDFFLPDIYKIDKDFLRQNNIAGLLLDVDNTLISNTVTNADEKLSAWVSERIKDGTKLCIVSNGKGKRVKTFNVFEIPAVHNAHKPARHGFIKAAALLELKIEETAVVGDQIYTDILGGNHAGFTTILISPIDKFENMFIRLKRVMEKPILRRIKERDI